MPSPSELIRYYQDRVAECELLAELTDNPEHRQLLFHMAREWRTFIKEDAPKTEQAEHFAPAPSSPKH